MGTGSNDGMVKAAGMLKATRVVDTTGSTSTFVTNAGAGGAAAEMMLVSRAAMSRYNVWSRQMRRSAEVQSSARDWNIEKSASEVDLRVLSAHR